MPRGISGVNLDAAERAQLMMLYCSIVSFQYHPGVKSRMSYVECMCEAMSAYNVFVKASEELWPGLVRR